MQASNLPRLHKAGTRVTASSHQTGTYGLSSECAQGLRQPMSERTLRIMEVDLEVNAQGLVVWLQRRTV